jgi:uncharacterized Tic20 family protein
MTTDREPTQVDATTESDVVASEAVEQPNQTEMPEPTSESAQAPISVDERQELTSESRNWATFAHLSAFVMFLGIPSLIGPLVVWLAKKDDPYVEAQAKEALNFNISMLIYAIAAGISILLVIGIIALPAVFIAWFVLVIIAAIRSADGEEYRYPFTIRLVS